MLPLSRILLQHIHKNYSNIRGRLEHRLLQETVQAFTITNDELASKGSGKKMEGFQECVNTCKVWPSYVWYQSPHSMYC